MDLKIKVIPVAQLSAVHMAAWCRFQQADPALANPFFRPQFTSAVAAERNDVEVAVWEESGEPVGFLPFERSTWGIGRAVGSCMNQFHGVIARSDVALSPQDFVRAAGLRCWRFDRLAAGQNAFGPYGCVIDASPYLDLSQGFEHYRKSRGNSAARFISHIFQKDRKAGRDLGEVRLEASTDRGTLARLLEWKIDQCRRTHTPCWFRHKSFVRLHERLLDHESEHFSGMFFCLYLGDRLAAGFFCIRSGGMLQGSVLGYDRELSRFAPGLVLLMRLAQTANSLGVTRINLGARRVPYKDKLASNSELVTGGVVALQPFLASAYHGWIRAQDRLRTTSLRGPVQRARRCVLSTRLMLGFTE